MDAFPRDHAFNDFSELCFGCRQSYKPLSAWPPKDWRWSQKDDEWAMGLLRVGDKGGIRIDGQHRKFIFYHIKFQSFSSSGGQIAIELSASQHHSFWRSRNGRAHSGDNVHDVWPRSCCKPQGFTHSFLGWSNFFDRRWPLLWFHRRLIS